MPKDEFEFSDPLELTGMALFTEADTSEAMCDCFMEEYLRMGHSPRQILRLFHNPHYLAMNLVLQNRGEAFVRQRLREICARWGGPAPDLDDDEAALSRQLNPGDSS